MNIPIICLHEEAFFTLVEQVVQRLNEANGVKAPKWIDDKDAMALLNIKSKTSLQRLRDTGKIRYSQPQKKIILYDRESIEKYINLHARNTF